MIGKAGRNGLVAAVGQSVLGQPSSLESVAKLTLEEYMALEFNISCEPHPLNTINVERERAAKDRATFRGKNIRFLIYFLAVLGSYVAAMLIFIIPHLNEPQFGIGSYFLPYITFVIFVLGNSLHTKYVEKPKKIVDAAIVELQATTPDELLEHVGSGEYPLEITSYLDKIAAHERSPVRAEIDVVKKWIAGQVAIS